MLQNFSNFIKVVAVGRFMSIGIKIKQPSAFVDGLSLVLKYMAWIALVIVDIGLILSLIIFSDQAF